MVAKRIETEILIVGSGPVGATYARLLAPHREVVMIDSGAQLSGRPGEHMLNQYVYQVLPNISLGSLYGLNQLYSLAGPTAEPRDPDPGPGPRAYNPPIDRMNWNNPPQNPNTDMPNAAAMYAVGGMGIAWSCFAPRPAPFERTPLVPAADWELLLGVADALLDVHLDAFEPSAIFRALERVLAGDADLDLKRSAVAARKLFTTPQAWVVRWTATDTILGPLLDPADPRSANLRVLPQHRAERLDVRGAAVERVLVRDLGANRELEIRAEQVVVAGNAFLTPRLLWQSGIRPWALGRYLNENTIAACTVGLNDRVVEALREDPLNRARGEVVPLTWNDPPPKCGFSPTEEKPWMAHFNRTARYLSYGEADWDARTLMDLSWYGPVAQRPENRITFSETEVDRFGQPQITIEYALSTHDVRVFEAMMADLSHVAPLVGAYLPVRTSSLNAQGEAGPVYQPAGTSLHFMGTYRMGAEDERETSVVDADSRVWDLENLWLGGPGVIPVPMASNPTLTACALAVKSAASMLGVEVGELARDLAGG